MVFYTSKDRVARCLCCPSHARFFRILMVWQVKDHFLSFLCQLGASQSWYVWTSNTHLVDCPLLARTKMRHRVGCIGRGVAANPRRTLVLPMNWNMRPSVLSVHSDKISLFFYTWIVASWMLIFLELYYIIYINLIQSILIIINLHQVKCCTGAWSVGNPRLAARWETSVKFQGNINILLRQLSKNFFSISLLISIWVSESEGQDDEGEEPMAAICQKSWEESAAKWEPPGSWWRASCPANRTNPQEEESVAADLLVGTVARWTLLLWWLFFFIVPTACYILLAFHKFPNLLVILTQLSLKTNPWLPWSMSQWCFLCRRRLLWFRWERTSLSHAKLASPHRARVFEYLFRIIQHSAPPSFQLP